MSILALVLFAWAVACWFSGPFDIPFLGLVFFHVDPIAPFTAALIAAVGALSLWFLRRGKRDLKRIIAWLRENRLQTILLIAIILLHLVLQLPSILLYRGANDSDSALLGLGGYHIASGESRQMFRHGTSYIGSLPQHLAAPLHLLFGKSPIYLRLINSLFYCGFIVFTYILARMLIGRRTAIYGSLLAALAPYEIMVHLRHTEFAEIAFWGSLSLVILAVMLKRKRPSWKQYFWYGATLGILFYAHPQGVYLIATGIVALFLKNKLFFTRPAFYCLPMGFVLGSIVTFIDSFYHDWIIFRVFFESEAGVSALTRLSATIADYLGHIPQLLGLRRDFGSTDLLGSPVTWIVLAAAAAALIIFLIRRRADLVSIFRLKDSHPAPLIPLILVVCVSLIYCFSRFSEPPAPMRYLFPLWLAVPILFSAQMEDWKTMWGKSAGALLIFIFAATFLASQAVYDSRIIAEEQEWSAWQGFLERNEISAFYGNYWVVYQTAFITAEKVIGSASYPDWLERYEPYTRAVDNSPTPPAYVFSPKILPYHKDLADGLGRMLGYLGIKYQRSEIEGRIVIHGLSERATPGQLRDLRGQNGARILNCAVKKIAGSGGANLRLLIVSIRNTGKTIWYSNGLHGFAELLALSRDGEVIRRQPLFRDVPPGVESSWWMVIDELEASGGKLGLQLRLNDIIIDENKDTLWVDLDAQADEPDVALRDLDALALFSKGSGGPPADYMLLSGWGATKESGDRPLHWSGSTSSKIGFLLRHTQNLRIDMLLIPYTVKDSTRPVTIRILCNENEIRSAEEVQQSRRVTLFLNENLLRRGWNTITFDYSHTEPEYLLEHRRLHHRIRPKAIALSRIRLRRDPGDRN